ncbi:MAG: serine hydrolase [Fimbriimonadaceae bacterium]
MLGILALMAMNSDIPSTEAILSRSNRYMSDAVRFDHFSGSVLISRKGRILLNKGFGYAQAERKIQNKSTTKFRIGSVSKQFTAAAIMRLQEQGKLKTSDSITKFIKSAPSAWAGITIKNLLNHTSGLINYTSLKEASGSFLESPHSSEEVLALFRDKPLESTPGVAFNYNNSGYFLLGLVIEKCSGQSLGDYLTENIFKPAGMLKTDLQESPKSEPGRAVSYRMENGIAKKAPFIHMNNLFAIGGASSTTEDLWTWEKALRAGKILNKSSVAEILRPGKGDYGFGWIIDTIGGHRRSYHDGGVNDFSTSLQHLTDEDITVIAISNRGDDGGIRVAYDLVGWICGAPATIRGIQPELLSESAESSYKRITAARKRFPIFDIRESKVKELGNYLVISRNKPQALELFKLNAMLYPESSDAHYRLALNYSWANQTDLARQHIQRSLRLDPKNSDAITLSKRLSAPINSASRR